MINIINNKDCCGCSACVSICPKHCIMLTEDEEGFLYPKVNSEICIDCGLCERVCNELNPYNKREPIQVLAAINKNEEVREKSSSGGVFYVIAEKIISKGGVVFGARFDKNWQVVIDFSEDMKGVESFMGSKYVQARMDTAYIDVVTSSPSLICPLSSASNINNNVITFVTLAGGNFSSGFFSYMICPVDASIRIADGALICSCCLFSFSVLFSCEFSG